MGGGSEDFLIIPQPRFMERRPGMCLIRGRATATTVDPSLHADLGDEGYRLSVSPGGVVIRASTAAGAFYAGQTLRQLLPPRSEHEGGEVEHSIPCVEIEDGPRFTWRGCMLDEGRSFHGTETVKLLLDLMALHKLNVFHWHLTEDQGWRIEIRAYPRLTTVGALRGGSMRAPRSRPDNLPYSGFYTQEEIREIVSYASERFITIVPEIDFPGHARAALAAYPALGCTRGPYDVWDHVGIQPEIMCAGREGTFAFLQSVLEEVMAMFPGPWIHLGGDEAPKQRWNVCADCRARMASVGAADANGLQTWMTNRVASFLKSRGRSTIVWNDSLGPDLDPDIAIQHWLHGHGALRASVTNGRRMVASSFWRCYLDHGYALTPLSRAYDFEPVWRGLEAQSASRVLGIEAPIWTEMIPDRARLWYQVFPRLCAYAETGWSRKDGRDFAFFLRRLPAMLERMRLLGAGHAPMVEVESRPLKRLFGILSIYQEQQGVAAP